MTQARAVSFASDNYAPAFPELFKILEDVSHDHMKAYGADDFSAAAEQAISEYCGHAKKVLFTFNGTGANILSLALAAKVGSTVLCSEYSHIHCDEGGAPEALLGIKLKPISTRDGKIAIESLKQAETLEKQGDRHSSQISCLSLSMSSEYGTVYSLQEIKDICDWAKSNGILVHVDGARILNATAYLAQKNLAYLKEAGVDILSFGGTKAGLIFGEAVVIWNEKLVSESEFAQKRLLQLSSKMRYVSRQFLYLIEQNYGLQKARHANEMAEYLASQLKAMSGLVITQKVQANAVFVQLPVRDYSALQKRFPFYLWNKQKNEARLMCSWNLERVDVDNFVSELEKSLL